MKTENTPEYFFREGNPCIKLWITNQEIINMVEKQWKFYLKKGTTEFYFGKKKEKKSDYTIISKDLIWFMESYSNGSLIRLELTVGVNTELEPQPYRDHPVDLYANPEYTKKQH